MGMSGDVPLLPGFPDQPTESQNTSGGLQIRISERVEKLLGFKTTNPYFIKFIDKFCHPDQLKCTPNDTAKQLYNAKLGNWEKMFTDSFYRAAVIVAEKEKRLSGELHGVNIENIIRGAQELIQQEQEDRESARKDIGYSD